MSSNNNININFTEKAKIKINERFFNFIAAAIKYVEIFIFR